MLVRPSKESSLRFVCRFVPLYTRLFKELQAEGGRVRLESPFAAFREKISGYVTLYDDERKIGFVMMKALLGEEGLDQFKIETASWSEPELEEFVDYSVSQEAEDELAELLDFPETEDEWKRRSDLYLSLPDDEKKRVLTREVCLFSGVFCQVFNVFSLMTHGAKLTTLVPQAMQGDADAFLKAVQVDRLLLTHHPYFVQRKRQAQDDDEKEFLQALAYRESNPNLKGKIRYPGLFMLFGLLESVQWLDDLRHEEILDLCDEIGLDRFQNRIEDVNYLAKRLLDYRRFQKTGGLSMH